MARLETIRCTPNRPVVQDGTVRWTGGGCDPVAALPQIVWENGTTWGEANVWALQAASTRKKDIETIRSAMNHLLAYAKWQELENIPWWHFPEREADRCLVRFRGYLVKTRDAGGIMPSVASARMAAVIRFYRWLEQNRLISTSWPMWSERQVGIRLTDAFGFEHTMRVASTDLAIPRRAKAGELQLEDGVSPVSIADMREILRVAELTASIELQLMLNLGFQTGMRIGSITDLKTATLRYCSIDPVAGWHRLAVGPKARPPVRTKFGIDGHVPTPSPLLDELLEYSTSTRRLKRQALASPEHRDLLFLGRHGAPYFGTNNRGVNMAMTRLREAGARAGVIALRDFHFHRTRATFATTLMRAALRFLPAGDAVKLVRDACLHKNESTTLKYVKFIEVSAAMTEAADAFTEAFMGLAKGKT